MSVILTIGGQKVGIDKLTDLVSQGAAATLFSIADAIISDNLNKPISAFPQPNNSARLNYSGGNNRWTVGNFTFGLSGNVVGSVSILEPGQTIATYTKTFPITVGSDLGTKNVPANTETITVPAGQYYVQVCLDLTLAADVSASVPVGAIGITGSFGSNDTFQVNFFKLVDGNTLLIDALKAAFAGFVLPLHSQTYQELQPGDYLFHQFNATLHLGFGATYGLNQVLFAGQYKGDVKVVSGGPTLNTSVNLKVQAGATMSAGFKYTGSFEALLWKTDNNTGRFHLYKNSVTDKYFNVGATVSAIADPSVSISAGQLKNLAGIVMPGTTGEVVGTLLSGKAQTDVDRWVSDLQRKITSWLQPLQQGKTSLQLAIDDTRSSFLLTDFTFELNQPGFGTAWAEALSGDFVAALAVPNGGASLDVGSGLEHFYTRKTSITFNFFGLTAAWTATNIANYSIVYAGNNTFNLIENIGRARISTVNSSRSEVDFYFAAKATSGLNGTVNLGDVDLHVILKAVNNRSAGSKIATIISSAATGSVPTMLGKQLELIALRKNTTESLELVFKPKAYARLSAATIQNGAPSGDIDADKSNYAAFQAACGQLMGSPPGNFKMNPAMDYDLWSIWSIASNNEYPPQAGDHADRRNVGAPSGSAVEQYINTYWPGSAWPPVSYAFEVAGDFMNLCEDLRNLAVLMDGHVSWDNLLSDLKQIIKNDLNLDFLPALTLALITRMENAGVQPRIVGPAPNAVNEPTIAVTLQFA